MLVHNGTPFVAVCFAGCDISSKWAGFPAHGKKGKHHLQKFRVSCPEFFCTKNDKKQEYIFGHIKTGKRKEFHFMENTEKRFRFWKGIRTEFKKITWPKKKKAALETAGIILVSLILGLLIRMLDVGIQNLIQLIQ